MENIAIPPKRRAARKAARTEFTCVRCGFTKYWTQKQWDTHMWKVHKFRNEQVALPF